jgi:hypothetical protein
MTFLRVHHCLISQQNLLQETTNSGSNVIVRLESAGCIQSYSLFRRLLNRKIYPPVVKNVVGVTRISFHGSQVGCSDYLVNE